MATYVIAFESTHAAMAASEKLMSGGMRFETIPVPPTISAGCGIALRITTEDPHDVLMLLFGEELVTSDAKLYRQKASGIYELDSGLRFG